MNRPLASRRLRRGALFTAVATAVAALQPLAPARACDLCAIYTATQVQGGRTGPRLSVAEQYTRFGTWRDAGEKVPNPGEFIDSSNTQIIAGYNFHERFGLQISLPIISRKYRRVESDELKRGSVAGIGDLTVIGQLTPYTYVDSNSVVRLTLLGGLKLPSGSSKLLGEEVAEDDGAEPDALRPPAAPSGPGTTVRAHSPGEHGESGVHGHDLTLGTGSVDGVVGVNVYTSWRRLFLRSGLQYAIRRGGSFHYEYANDLLWEISPGFYPLLDDTMWRDGVTLAIAAVFSGETKGNDTLRGEKTTDTAITALYLGPGLDFTWGSALHIAVGADLPLLQNNSSLQIVPDYRIRGGITWRF